MYEHETESDEDCEVYFLKPVNEYNIVDKIKEANKELFANDEATAAGGGKVTKVTFALNLEDYEPTPNTNTTGGVDQKEDSSPSPPDELLMQLTQLKLKPIAEADEPLPEIKKAVEDQEEEEEDEVEEEICEEILDLSDPAQKPPAPPQPPPPEALVDDDEDDDFSGVDEADLDDEPSLTLSKVTSASSSALQRRQATFDGGDDYDEGESDQKSLTNLLTESDCEEEERTLNEARLKLRQAYKSLYKTLDSKELAKIDKLTGLQKEKPQPTTQSHHIQHQDADEDDDLSIIVASYIPDDFELNEQSIYYKNEEEEGDQGNGAPPINHTTTSTGCPKSTSKNFFNTRRFSFRRRAKPTPSISLTSASNRSSSSTNNSSALSPTIKMNYKTCCEHRHSLQEKLPRYTGYMSEYGLSAQQLQRRDQQIRRKKRFAMEQTLNRNEQELKKMQDNERAFTTWLKNKMRYPINKTRNMFDAHKRRGSVAAAAVAAGSSPNHHHHHHPASSASRLRRRDSSSDEPVIHAYRHLLGSWNK
ncbi:eukaryotic translation initiation factor 5B [Drosophila tropicalis]|uniref:eukaryotic translation initiation factor 5B n=1 Tax=Drosophila tropicalis TaxID=46794 RepID=UPI0035ABC272